VRWGSEGGSGGEATSDLEVDPEAAVEGRRCLECFDRERRGMDGEQGGNAVWKRRVGDTVRGEENRGRGGEATTGCCFGEVEVAPG
jgi:hypothetical protein